MSILTIFSTGNLAAEGAGYVLIKNQQKNFKILFLVLNMCNVGEINEIWWDFFACLLHDKVVGNWTDILFRSQYCLLFCFSSSFSATWDMLTITNVARILLLILQITAKYAKVWMCYFSTFWGRETENSDNIDRNWQIKREGKKKTKTYRSIRSHTDWENEK